MIRPLRLADSPASIDADVLVIGAGIAGLILATRLAAAGRHVVVLESGGERPDEESHALNAVEQLGAVYAGAEQGRARCLGGTSTLWGGALIPYLPADLDPAPAIGDAGWPVTAEAILRYLPSVERLFGLPAGPYDHPEIARADLDPPFLPRLAKWPAFGKRNVASLLAAELRATNLDIWTYATASGFVFAPDGRLDAVTARAPDGAMLSVRARQVVIAAGAIESTRLLLLADRDADQRIFAPYDVLGRYFHDHLSVDVARVLPADRRAFNRTVGFRFEGAGMRNLRFEPSQTPHLRAGLCPGFAHITFEETDGGFAALRDLLRRLQQRRLPDIATVMALARGTPWLAQAIWWRLVEERLLAPREAAFALHVVIEQQALPSNRISLSTTQRDEFGMPRAAIEWRVSQGDRDRLTHFTDRFLAFWGQNPALADLAAIERRPAGEAERAMETGGGIYHPCGSTRMGGSAADGVVDADLRCFGVPNLSVLATSAFPTAGGANPTMTLACAAIRLADRLAGSMCGQAPVSALASK